jgi:hypothetical protein
MFLAQVGVGIINSRVDKLSPRIDDGSGCDAVPDPTGILEMFLSQVSAKIDTKKIKLNLR